MPQALFTALVSVPSISVLVVLKRMWRSAALWPEVQKLSLPSLSMTMTTQYMNSPSPMGHEPKHLSPLFGIRNVNIMEVV